MKKIIGNSLALAGLIIITIVLLAAILAPIISPYDPNFIDIDSILIAPANNLRLLEAGSLLKFEAPAGIALNVIFPKHT